MALNIGSGQPISIREIAVELSSTLGVEIPIEITGKYRAGEPVDSVRAGGVATYLGTGRGDRVLAGLERTAAAHGTHPAAVALAWLAAQPGVVTPIASARTPEQLRPLLAYPDLRLTDAEVTALTEASA